MEAYKRYLRGSYLFRTVLDEQLTDVHWPAQLSLWASTDPLTHLMRQDMQDLDMVPPQPVAPSSSPIMGSDMESLLGTLYVVEGSSLGARVLYRRAQALGLSHVFGARHLAVQAQSNERWKRLLELLEAAPELDLDRTVEASKATFDAVERAFKDPQHV